MATSKKFKDCNIIEISYYSRRQHAARNRAERTQSAIRKAEVRRERLLREIQQLQATHDEDTNVIHGDDILPDTDLMNENVETIDLTSPLSKELQRHPWPFGYKPRIPAFDGKSSPNKFIASYETAVISAGGDNTTLAKSLIMSVEDIAHDWYMSLKPLSINSWQQMKAELLATFQGYQSWSKTAGDLLNCVQQDNEPLSKYLERFI